ncbi:hypothetical protein evm_010641 [Chilo suppressalis]|nr:hypothetical protein evm_010641 [Chilo suppressalis]
MLSRAKAAMEMAEPSQVVGGEAGEHRAASTCAFSATSSQRASHVARQKAAEAKLQRTLAELAKKQAAMAEEAAARAEFDAETAAIETSEVCSRKSLALSARRTAQWVEEEAHVTQKSTKWCDYAATNSYSGKPSVKVLAQFLHTEASKQARYMPRYASLSANTATYPERPKAQTAAAHRVHNSVTSVSNISCLYCLSDHSIKMCPKFAALSIDDRWSWVRQAKVCNKCFRKRKHSWRSCRIKCNICSQNHHSLFHKDIDVNNSQTQNVNSVNTRMSNMPVVNNDSVRPGSCLENNSPASVIVNDNTNSLSFLVNERGRMTSKILLLLGVLNFKFMRAI